MQEKFANTAIFMLFPLLIYLNSPASLFWFECVAYKDLTISYTCVINWTLFPILMFVINIRRSVGEN